jgi:hypothetical protein
VIFPASLRFLQGLGFEPFDAGAFDLNMILWRGKDRTPGLLNDGLSVVYRLYSGNWREDFWAVNIDPSPRYLVDPVNPAGTLVIPAGRHPGAWKVGTHKGRRALVQASTLTVGRDGDRDLVIDPTTKDRGWFGWNLHNGGADDSAGCTTTGEGEAGQRVVDAVRGLLSDQIRHAHGDTVTVTVVDL